MSIPRMGLAGSFAMADFDRVADIYDSTRKFPEEVIRVTVSAIEKVLAGRKKILDLGVGTGRFSKPLTELGFDVVGVDVSLGMMEKARAKGVWNLVRADGHQLPFADASFEAAVVILFLHLVRDWAAAVREIGRVCDGPILSIVGASSGPNVRASYLEMRKDAGFPTGKLDDDAEGLRKILTPRKIYMLADQWEEVNADDSIKYLDGRGSSITWEIPERVHRRIIESLRATFGGRVLRRRVVDQLGVWDAEQFRHIPRQKEGSASP